MTPPKTPLPTPTTHETPAPRAPASAHEPPLAAKPPIAARGRVLAARFRAWVGRFRRPRVQPRHLAFPLVLAATAAVCVAAWRSEASHATAPVPAPSFEHLVACKSSGGVDRSGNVVYGPLDGKMISEVLRGHGLKPDDVYRVRRALELIPGFHAPSAGRFVAALEDASDALASFQLVVSASEIYRATSDGHGGLVGERAHGAPERRLCFGAMTVGASFDDSLDAAPFHHEIAPELEAALGTRFAAEKAEPGTKIRAIARELVAMGTFAGYDGVEAVEIVPAGDAARARRAYRVEGDPSPPRYVDARGNPVDASSPASSNADLSTPERWIRELDARLDAIAWPSDAPPATPTASPSESAEPSAAPERDEPPPDRNLTVARAARRSCSTHIVEGLAEQVIAESRCLVPNAFTRVPSRKNLHIGNVFLYLEPPARDQLLAALDAQPKRTMTVNSALRTLPQQILLAEWGETQRCGVKLAANPGESNHESGLALDIREASAWRPILEKRGFRWMGHEDPVHFDYKGPSAVDHRGLDVRAFQRLWTRNHPDDALPETGRVDQATDARVRRSPAAGFPIGARCGR